VQHRDSRTPFEAWVNPADPQQALLFREKTTTLYALPLFGLVFALAGLGVSTFGVVAAIRNGINRSRLNLNPDRPWRATSRWQTFQVHDNPGGKIAGSLAIALFTALFLSIFVVVLHGDKSAPLFARIIVALLCLIPAGALISAIYHILRHLKYGNATLAFRQLPFVIGAGNSAILHVREHIASTGGTELTLQCVRKEWVKRGKDYSEEERVLYSERKTVQSDLAEKSGRGSAIPVQFNIPAGQPDTFTGEYPKIVWRLIATAATPGIDFSARFEIPVYHVADPSLIDTNPLIARTTGTRQPVFNNPR
jgi:hypothetical protein